MNRKEELQILIDHKQKEFENMSDLLKDMLNNIAEGLKGVLINSIGIKKELIGRVRLSDSYAWVVFQLEDGSKTSGDLTIYTKNYLRKEISLGWYSSGASKTEMVNLIYLECVGKIANDIREAGCIESFLDEAYREYNETQSVFNRLDIELRSLKHELHNIKMSELDELILNQGGVRFEKTLVYIKDSDRRREYVDFVEITKVSDKTMTLTYKCGEFTQRTLRLSIADARNSLRYLYNQYCVKHEEVAA
jgi:hypothetical protein